MKTMENTAVITRIGRFVHRFRTAFLFWMYILALMLYAYRWMPA
ncbi:hypothetical protein [Robiginitalea sediminis]|nr:hypothetical protein [Robiginitalea sediminis]